MIFPEGTIFQCGTDIGSEIECSECWHKFKDMDFKLLDLKTNSILCEICGGKTAIVISMDAIIIGQEAICPDGLGRVIAFNFDNPNNYIQVSTYINDRQCKWDKNNVELINPRK